MEPVHINFQKLQLLDERIKNVTNISNIESQEEEKMVLEKPKSIPKGFMSAPQRSLVLEDKIANESSNKENEQNSKLYVNLESSEKIEDLPVIERGISKGGNVNQTSELSFESLDLKGSQSLKKRKYDQYEQHTEKPAGTFEMITKKTKLTPMKLRSIDNTNLTKDSMGSAGQDPLFINKENIAVGTKKITEFFKPKEAIATLTATSTSTQKPQARSVAKKTTKGKGLSEKKQEVIVEAKASKENEGDDKKELYLKIKELEERVEAAKKDREKDHLKLDKEIKAFQDEFSDYKMKVQKMSAKHVLEIENYKRAERKAILSRQRQRLGEYVSQREGSKFVDVWSDGYEVRQVKEKLENMIREREELEKQKKNMNSKKSTASASKASLQESYLGLSTGIFGYPENSDSNSSVDLKEIKERVTARLTMLQREEALLREQLEKLEVEKDLFYQQYKKQYEEDHSRYGKPNAETNAPAWPILDEKYQLLSLLGKGGFSEVYKAYDLEDLMFVAAKVHQLNPNWTEKSKSNYVKHANREFEVHKELNHPNIVRLYDCINIDDHSFATILEYCEGPDLSMYLKQYKILPEKDAKVIIKQILAGLKYLSDHKTKIIHYDLKPQNVMFHRGEIKISDFGLCKIVDPDVSRIELTSQGVGTYWYLPPECFLLDDQPPMINNKVDVWSVGVMFYEMLFGMRPFGHGMSQEKILKDKIILKSHNVTFPAKPVISAEAKDFIKKCLAYSQEDRIDIYGAYDLMYYTKK